VSYIIFQLYTHTHLYVDKNNPDVAESKRYNLHPSAETATAEGADHSSDGTVAGDTEAGGHVNTTEEEEEEEQPQTSMIVALVLLAIITVLVAITAEFLVDSINGLTDTPGSKISKEFVSIILLAIVGNAAGESWLWPVIRLPDPLSLQSMSRLLLYR
jgi:Ca2+:H+ antiporter